MTLLVTICSHLGPGNETISFPDSALPLPSGMESGNEIVIILAISTHADFSCLFIYLFIHLFINFAKRPHKASSITRPREEKRKEKRKLEIQILTEWQYFRNDKKQQWKTELERTLIKNQQLIRSSKLFSGRLVWHLIHTLKGLWGVDISETQVVKDLIKVRYWTVNVPEEGC